MEKWGVFEAAVNGKSDGNPFLDYEIKGTFVGEHETVKVSGFYDGEGVYRVRFMPSYEGKYTYTIQGSAVDAPVRGEFEAVAPTSAGCRNPKTEFRPSSASDDRGLYCWTAECRQLFR